jgi:hypothetical protein
VIFENGLRKGRALIWEVGLVADERDRAFGVKLTQRVTDAGSAYTAADDQIITLDHA